MPRSFLAAAMLLLTALPATAQQAPAQGQPVPPNMEGQPIPKGPIWRIGEDLVGTRWKAVALMGRPPLEGSAITLEFLRGSYVRGGSGCNRYVGPWATRADHAVFGPLRKSRLRCSALLDGQEDHYLLSLDAAERMELQDKGQTLLIYVMQEKEPVRYTRLP